MGWPSARVEFKRKRWLSWGGGAFSTGPGDPGSIPNLRHFVILATWNLMGCALPRQAMSMPPRSFFHGVVISFRTTDLRTELPFTRGLSIVRSLLRLPTLTVK